MKSYLRNTTHTGQELEEMFTNAFRGLSTIDLIFYCFNNDILNRFFNAFESAK